MKGSPSLYASVLFNFLSWCFIIASLSGGEWTVGEFGLGAKKSSIAFGLSEYEGSNLVFSTMTYTKASKANPTPICQGVVNACDDADEQRLWARLDSAGTTVAVFLTFSMLAVTAALAMQTLYILDKFAKTWRWVLYLLIGSMFMQLLIVFPVWLDQGHDEIFKFKDTNPGAALPLEYSLGWSAVFVLVSFLFNVISFGTFKSVLGAVTVTQFEPI